MDKKWLWFLLGIAIPCLLNLIFYFEVIPSSLSSNSWLVFGAVIWEELQLLRHFS